MTIDLVLKKKVSAIVLASGFSRRMGEQEKLLLPVGEKTMLGHLLDTILDTTLFQEIILVAREPKVIEEGAKRNIRTIKNDQADEGISASIRKGIEAATGNYYMFFVADQPFLEAKHIQILYDAIEDEKIICPRAERASGNPCIFPKKFREKLLALKDEEGGKQVIKSQAKDVKYIDIVDPEALRDIDDYEQYKRMRNDTT